MTYIVLPFFHLEGVTPKYVTSSRNGEELVRKKRFLAQVFGSALQSLRSDNWRECGRTSWGTTIYTNGVSTSCYGACPKRIYCGYGYNDYGGPDGYGYRLRNDVVLAKWVG